MENEEDKKVVDQPYVAMYVYGTKTPTGLVLCRFGSLMPGEEGTDEILGSWKYGKALEYFNDDRYELLAHVNTALSAYYRTQVEHGVNNRSMLAFFGAYVDELGKQKR